MMLAPDLFLATGEIRGIPALLQHKNQPTSPEPIGPWRLPVTCQRAYSGRPPPWLPAPPGFPLR